MVLYFYRLENDTFTKVAVIDNATSVIWVKRFNAVLSACFCLDEIIIIFDDKVS